MFAKFRNVCEISLCLRNFAMSNSEIFLIFLIFDFFFKSNKINNNNNNNINNNNKIIKIKIKTFF